jgi:signal transduction histidine kinase
VLRDRRNHLYITEKAMLWRALLFVGLVATFTQAAVAQDQPPSSPEAKRIEALVNKAAALVDAKGKAAFSEFRQRGSEWWSGDVYVFAYSHYGTVILNPAFPEREGEAYLGEEDNEGNAFHDELLNTAQTKGSGWIAYWVPKSGQTKSQRKWAYVKAVKAGGVALVGAAYYPE